MIISEKILAFSSLHNFYILVSIFSLEKTKYVMSIEKNTAVSLLGDDYQKSLTIFLTFLTFPTFLTFLTFLSS